MASALNQQNPSKQASQNSNILKVRNYIIGKLFKINHVLLDNQPLNSSLFQLIMLFEFIQMLFYVFHKVPVINEFMPIQMDNSTMLNSTSAADTGNGTQGVLTKEEAMAVTTDVLSQENIYRLDLQLLFANFQLYPLQARSLTTFEGLYAILNIMFYMTMFGMIAFAEEAFRSLNTDQLKDGISLVVKSLSLLTTLFMTVLFIPMITTNVQGFLCSEIKDDYYVLTSIKCNTTISQILTAVSSITIVLFILFCFLQRSLLTSPNLDSLLPWAQLESAVEIIRLGWKFYISLAFMLNKFANYRNELKLLSFAIGAIISYQRLSTSKIYNRRVHFFSTLYDIVATWFFLCIPVHEITGSQLTIMTVLAILVTGCMIGGFLIYLSELRNIRVFLRFTANNDGDMMRMIKSSRQAEILIYHIMKYIGKTQEQLDSMAARGITFGRGSEEWNRIKENGRIFILNGIITNHLERCLLPDCTCKDIYGEMFENQSFLHDTWHMLQEEEYKGYLQNNMPKAVTSLLSSETLQTYSKNKKNHKQPTSRPSDDVSQNLEEINSMLRHINTVKMLQSQDNVGMPNTKEIEETKYQKKQVGIVVEKFNEIDLDGDKRASKMQLLENQMSLQVPRNSQSQYNNEDTASFTYAKNHHPVDSHSSQAPSQQKSNEEGIPNNDIKGFQDYSFKRKVTFDNNDATQNNYMVEEIKDDHQKENFTSINQHQQHEAKPKSQDAMSRNFGGNLLEKYNLRNDKDASRVLHQLSLKQHRQDFEQISPPAGNDQDSTNSKPHHSAQSSNVYNQINAEQQQSTDLARSLLQNSSHEFFNYHKEQQIMHFLFAALVLDRALAKFPKSNELRVHSSLIQSEQLTNEFKAVFELMKCNQTDVSLPSSFQIFRRKILIERKVMQKSSENSKIAGKLDPLNAYKYEKLCQRFVRFEYLAANSALSFWKELLQNQNFDTQLLQKKGAQITHCYTRIQELIKEIENIKPNCISIICRYAVFLKRIVNNENQAIINYDKAVGFFQSVNSSKGILGNISNQQAVLARNINETAIFGENTAAAVIMVSLQMDRVGTMIHTNDVIYRVLGYQRRDLIGQKVNKIQPRPIALVHDNILKRFLVNYKDSNFLNNTRQLYAISSEGYLRPISMLIKLYPQISGQITMIAFIQQLGRIEGFDLFSLSTEDSVHQELPHHLMITDANGSIDCVTKGLYEEVGLSCKFFGRQEQQQSNSINVDKLFGNDITSTDVMEQLQNTGLEFQLNTSHLLEYVNPEQLTEEELDYVKTRLGSYRANVMVRRIVFLGELYLYRIILLPVGKEDGASSSPIKKYGVGNSITSNERNSQAVDNSLVLEFNLQVGSSDVGGSEASHDMISSQYSASSRNSNSSGMSSTYYKMISDFKSSLGSRQTPRYIQRLSTLLTLVLICTIALTSIEYKMKESFVNYIEINIGEYLVKSEARYLKFIELSLDLRSIVNVANGAEFTQYQGAHLARIDRFNYLSYTIQKQADELQEIQDYLLTKRGIQQQVENQDIELYRLSSLNKIVAENIPYRQAMQNYLNNLLLLNTSTPEQLIMSLSLLPSSPFIPANSTFNKNITNLQRELYFNMANQFRDILAQTQFIKDQLHSILREESHSIYRKEFLATMILGLIVSLTSFALILRQTVETEQTKREIMSIFRFLSIQDIKQVYDVCDQYLENNFSGPGKLYEAHQENVNKYMMKLSASRGGQKKQASVIKNPWDENPKEHYGRLLRETQVLIKDQSIEKELSLKIKEEEEKVQSQKDKIKQTIIRKSMPIREPNESPKKKQENQAKLTLTSLSQQNQAKISKNQSRLMKRFGASTGNATAENSQSQRNLKSDFDSARNNQNDNSSSESEFDEEKHKEYQIQRQLKKKQMSSDQNEQDEKNKNLQKMHKSRGSNQKCFQILGLNFTVCLIFCTYFIFGFVFHIQELRILGEIIDNTPIFCKRYSNLYLTFGYLRERIISLNNPKIFSEYHIPYENPKNYTKYLTDIDEYYHAESMLTEQNIARLKILRPQSIANTIDFYSSITDSEQFCSVIVGLVQAAAEEKLVVKSGTDKVENIRKIAYQGLIDTVIAACTFASEGKLEQLKKVKETTNVNLNDGDYDRRTPLHVSCGAGKEDVVRYLVEEMNVNVNPIDRWGATPLNDCSAWPKLEKYMISKGAKLGKLQGAYTPFVVSITEDQFRIYYAAYFGDVEMMDNLRLLGWNVNGQDYDGRTAVGIAASEGHLDVIKYLISKGADLTIKDARGNDALGDARRENRTEVIKYLVNEALILVHCLDFEQQFFAKGTQQVIGVFNRKFQDLRILINSQPQTTQLYSLLGSTRFNISNSSTDGSTRRIMEVFTSSQELYMFKVVDKLLQVLKDQYTSYANNYFFITQVVFSLFIIIQILTLIVQKKKLIKVMEEEIFESRGILNLVPQSFLREHQDQVQNIMKIISSK